MKNVTLGQTLLREMKKSVMGGGNWCLAGQRRERWTTLVASAKFIITWLDDMYTYTDFFFINYILDNTI